MDLEAKFDSFQQILCKVIYGGGNEEDNARARQMAV
jgi:hypothetical protein